MRVMGLFSRRSPLVDLRDRDYRLTDCPSVAQDDQVALVNVTVRLKVRKPTDDQEFVLGYRPSEEIALHAICVMVLRQMAGDVPCAELLSGRSRVAEAIEQGLEFAPIGSGLEPRVLTVDVRRFANTSVNTRHESASSL